MKKICLNILLCFALFFGLIMLPTDESVTYAKGSALKSDKKILTVNEKVHSTMPEVTFEVSVPQDASEIDLNSLTLAKGLSIKSGSASFDKKTRKLKFTVIGQKVMEASQTVYGFNNTRGDLFQSNLKNAVCRYSDGKRWQVNTVSPQDFSMYQANYTSPTSKVPSDPPTDIFREIFAFSPQTLTQGATVFYYASDVNAVTADGAQLKEGASSVTRSLIDPTSLEVPKQTKYVFPKNTTSKSKRILFPNNYDPKNPKIGIGFIMDDVDSSYVELMMTRPISPKSPNFFGGHAGCWDYFSNYVYYIKAQTLPTEAYKYWGNVHFDYIPYGQAALVGELKVDPSSVQFKGNDIIVDVTMEAEVINIEDPGALDTYKVYVKLADGTMLSDGNKKESFNRKTKIKHTYKYTIAKNRLSSASVKDLTQEFEGRIIGKYKGSSYYTGELNTGLKKASTYVYKESPVPTPTPDPVDPKEPPVAVIDGDSEVKRGDYVVFSGSQSYDPDGTVEEYRWVMPGARQPSVTVDQYDATYSAVTAWYDALGPQKVILSVKDNDGLQGAAYHSFVVVEPTVEAYISQSGTLKENRKVTFTESSNTPHYYPIIPEKTTWLIQPISSESSASAIKHSGTLNGKKSIDVLFKQAGDYMIILSVENTAGYTSTTQRVFTIKPDEKPFADYTHPKIVYRDPTNNNLATVQLQDKSYSIDGDTIVRRNWYVTYDANNDGIFDEPKVLFNTGNNTTVEYSNARVGRYQFDLEVIEEFGQPTIDAFVTAADRRRANTWD